jgi:hypothetical protein
VKPMRQIILRLCMFRGWPGVVPMKARGPHSGGRLLPRSPGLGEGAPKTNHQP